MATEKQSFLLRKSHYAKFYTNCLNMYVNEFSSSLTSPNVKPDIYLNMNTKLLQSNLDIVLCYNV